MVNDKFIGKFIPTILGGLIFALILIFIYIVFTSLFVKKYDYIDMYGSHGTSDNCYYNEPSRDYRCMIPVKVQQFNKR